MQLTTLEIAGAGVTRPERPIPGPGRADDRVGAPPAVAGLHDKPWSAGSSRRTDRTRGEPAAGTAPDSGSGRTRHDPPARTPRSKRASANRATMSTPTARTAAATPIRAATRHPALGSRHESRSRGAARTRCGAGSTRHPNPPARRRPRAPERSASAGRQPPRPATRLSSAAPARQRVAQISCRHGRCPRVPGHAWRCRRGPSASVPCRRFRVRTVRRCPSSRTGSRQPPGRWHPGPA